MKNDRAKQIFGVVVERDDTVRVLATDVAKVTPQFYCIEAPKTDDWRERSDFHSAFGYRNRIEKGFAHVTARAALEAYMAKRQRDKENARAVVAQATKQIASANELLMHLPESPPAVAAVVPGVENTESSTRD